MTELLPCPFCGGEARVQHQSRKLYGDVVDWYGVYCNKQFCGYVSGQSTEAEAVAAWNKRAERTCHRDEYEAAPFSVCSECGAVLPDDCTVYYCWSCGAKVVEQ